MRLLTLKGIPPISPLLFWEGAQAKLKAQIEKLPFLRLVEAPAHLVFFDLPHEKKWPLNWALGLEVLGHGSVPPNEGYDFFDFDAGQCYAPATALSSDHIGEEETLKTALEMIQKLKEEGVEFEKTWQILLGMNSLDIQFPKSPFAQD